MVNPLKNINIFLFFKIKLKKGLILTGVEIKKDTYC